MEQMKQKNFVECECGIKVGGKSKEHARKLLPEHQRSKIHRERIEAIKFSKNKAEEESK